MTDVKADGQNDIALFSKDGENWSFNDGTSEPIHWRVNPQVTKIIIGKLDSDSPCGVDLPDRLSTLYPRLTHLHLWGLTGNKSIGRLPDGMRCLDIRRCDSLETISNIPNTLETLVLHDCPQIQLSNDKIVDFLTLRDIDISGSTSLSQDTVLQLLKMSPKAISFQAERCTQLKMIVKWPETLHSVVLNDCTALCSIPPTWPPQLRKLELSGATNIELVPDFGDFLDYIDLSHTHKLTHLPERRGAPTTLYLHDSGLLAPPASEHGDAHQNVAEDTTEFFNDLGLVGPGAVKRCKVQMLGNGAAGKTSLSLLLTGQDPLEADKLGSTHGVRFDATSIDTSINGLSHSLALQVWDFGGQEIYHGTHRLFMSKGSVFVILWKPGQDGLQPPPSDSGYQDEWRPLQYWIDLVHLSCRAPRIAVVCSHHSARSDTVLKRYHQAVRLPNSERPPLFFMDSRMACGELTEFNDWLRDSTTETVIRQGQEVPSYWEIAQDMVLEWLTALKSSSGQKIVDEQITIDEFRTKLEGALTTRTAAGDYPMLTQALRTSTFPLTENRLRRTLAFLTHSGWLFWSESLFERRVIVGQEWALDGLYMILERRDHQTIYDKLKLARGIFTRQELGELKWDREAFSEEEQELLLTYMQMCGLCFKLRDGTDAWLGKSVYQSIEHLPTAEESRLLAQFDNERPELTGDEDELSNNRMHSFHWRQFLANMGEHFGTAASYASDGILIRTDSNQIALIRCQINQYGIGGELTIEVSGAEGNDLLTTLRNHLISILPAGYDGKADRSPRDERVSVHPTKEETVFVSYAWKDKDWKTGDPDYEIPVARIKDYIGRCNALVSDEGRKVRLLIDKDEIKRLDSINEFMKTASKAPHVIAVHSQKYFKSVNCLYEMHLQSEREDAFMKIVVPVELDSRIGEQTQRDEYLSFWRGGPLKLPSRLEWNEQDARDYGVFVVRFCSKKFSDPNDYNLKWEGDGTAVLQQIASRLYLPVVKD